MFLTLAAPEERGYILPAGSVSRPLRVNRQSYELEILWLYIKFYLEQSTDKKVLSVKYILRTGLFVGDGLNSSVIGDVTTRSWFL